MAFKMKGNPLKMGSMATKSTMKMAKKSAMKMKKESPMEMGQKSPAKMKKGLKPSNIKDNDKITGTKTGKTGNKSVTRKGDTKPGGLKMKKGSAMKLSEEDKKKAMDNAMPEARVSSMSRETMDSAKKRKLMTASGSFDMDKAKTELRKLKSMSSPTAKNDAHQKELTRLIKAFS